jgi:FixJ family two-component response regulator
LLFIASCHACTSSLNKGAYDNITKPFRKEQILIAIDRALEWKNMRKELRELKEGKKR